MSEKQRKQSMLNYQIATVNEQKQFNTLVKLSERREELENLDLQKQFITKRDIDYENQRVQVA